MPDDTRTALLDRRYRRFLLAYPRRYRRERGPEILATLLEAAAPEQTRPDAREVSRLLRHGLGRRIADAGVRTFVVAAFAAVLGGLSGIALGSWISWRQVDPLAPDKPTATRLAHTVLPTPVHDEGYYGRHTFWNPYSDHSLHGGTGVRVGSADFTGKIPPHADYRRVTAAVVRQMRGHGWQHVHAEIDSYGTSPATHQATVTGTRAGYLASVQVDEDDGPNPTRLALGVRWAEPTSQTRNTVLGGIAGAVFGALLGALTSMRMRRQGRRLQHTYSWLCVATLLLLAPACLGNIPTSSGSFLSTTDRDGPGASIYWGGFVIFGAEPLAILSLVPILAILVACAWPRAALTRTASRA